MRERLFGAVFAATIIAMLVLIAAAARDCNVRKGSVDTDSETKYVGKAAGHNVYSIKDHREGIICYVTTDGICCLEDVQ